VKTIHPIKIDTARGWPFSRQHHASKDYLARLPETPAQLELELKLPVLIHPMLNNEQHPKHDNRHPKRWTINSKTDRLIDRQAIIQEQQTNQQQRQQQ